MCYSAHQIDVTKELNENQKSFLDANVRSVLNSCGLGTPVNSNQIAWANSLQRYTEAKPFGIPCFIASDPRNGQGVSDWPGNLSLAATFDPDTAREAARCQARELRDLGVTCFLAPQVDVGSDPRWFRFNGTFGCDPALARDMARAFCDGLQSTVGPDGEDLGWGKESVAAMVKHWTGEGAGEGGREAHLETGKYAVYPGNNFEALMIPFVDGAFRLAGKTERAAAVMSSYTIAWSEDGSLGPKTGSSFSEYKIRELLRNRFGFDGPVCTDWMVLNEGKAQGLRSCGWGEGGIESPNTDPAENALRAILAGVDQMGGCGHPEILVRAFRLGCERVGEETMRGIFAASAARLLKNYFLTGLFENPYLDEEACLADIDSADKRAAALEAQVKAVVMLKNSGHVIAPASGRKKVYIPALYEAAHDTYSHHGGLVHCPEKVSFPIRPEVCAEFFDVVTDRVEGTRIIPPSDEELKSCDLFLITAKNPENVYAQGYRAEDGGIVPLSIQYAPYTADGPHVRRASIAGDTLPDGSRENRSYYGRTSLPANPEQPAQIRALGEKARALGVPSLLCLFAVRPMCFHEFESSVDAILATFSAPTLYGGSDSSSIALARIAAGLAEPSGLLPMQMPRDMDAVEAHCEDMPRDLACHTDTDGHRYDFGFGMNYAGMIRDERVRKYGVPPLTHPAR